jgi:hypothetical protein
MVRTTACDLNFTGRLFSVPMPSQLDGAMLEKPQACELDTLGARLSRVYVPVYQAITTT